MRVYILDDEPVIRAGVRQALSADPGIEIVGEASTAREAFREIEAVRLDVAIMDIALPGMDGIAATRELKRRVPRASIVIFSCHDRLRDLLDVFEAGASAYVVKTEPLEALRTALQVVAKGERYVSPSLAPLVDRRGALGGTADALERLSVREREIFQLIAAGRSIVETAREYCISRKTVETHVYHLYRKLGCHNVGDLVRFAAEHGLLRMGPTDARRPKMAWDQEAGARSLDAGDAE